MKTIIKISDITTGKFSFIEIDSDKREIYEIELEGLYENELEAVLIYNTEGDIYFLSKELAKKKFNKNSKFVMYEISNERTGLSVYAYKR